jgi:hypothetical protein
MGEEVAQLVIADGGGVAVEKEEGQQITSIDETDRVAVQPALTEELIENSEIKSNCDGEPQKAEEEEAKRVVSRPQDTSIEKSTKKWYSFIHRTTTAPSSSSSSSGSNSNENKNSDKMDKRHSWHLNDSAVVEM